MELIYICIKGSMNFSSKKYLILTLFVWIAVFSYAQEHKTIQLVTNLDVPWDMEWLNKEVIVFTELGGTIKQFNLKTHQVKEIFKVEELAREVQSGLMGIAVHSDFKKNPFVYIVYTFYDTSFNLNTRVSRLRYSTQTEQLTNETILLDSIHCSSTNIGGRIIHHPDHYLYVTIGDAAYNPSAQDVSSLNGKILRINDDGSIPKDNPIKNSPIWTLGHRNPQGITLTPHGVYISEHGGFIDDEVNKIEKGNNYGWPEVTGSVSTTKYTGSIYNWSTTIAPSGIDYCPNCIGTNESALLVSSLKNKKLKVLWFDEQHKIVKETLLIDQEIGRIRDVLVSETGEIYICTSNKDIYGKHTKMKDGIFKLDF